MIKFLYWFNTINNRCLSKILATPDFKPINEDKNLKVSLDNFDKALLHPDQNDLKNAKDYALNILNQLK